MTYDEALIWYEVGMGSVFAFIGGPFLLVAAIRFARSFLSL